MANYAATALLEARAKLKQDLQAKFEQRPVMGKLINMFMLDRSLTIPNLADIREATTQATATEFLSKISDVTGTAKSCTPTGIVGDSGKNSLTWQVKNQAVSISHKRSQGNDYKYVTQLQNLLEQAEKNILFNANGIDAAMASYLDTNRTEINLATAANGAYNTWDGTNFNMDVALANKERFYVNMLAEMGLNNYEGEILEAANMAWRADALHQSQQGAQNSENLAYQFDPSMMVNSYLSNNLVPTTGQASTHFLVPRGGVAMLDWNDPLNRGGHVSGDKTWTTMRSVFIPELTYDVLITTACADTSASGGGTQDLVTTYELSLNFALTSQPFSTSGESAIFKYDIAKA